MIEKYYLHMSLSLKVHDPNFMACTEEFSKVPLLIQSQFLRELMI